MMCYYLNVQFQNQRVNVTPSSVAKEQVQMMPLLSDAFTSDWWETEEQFFLWHYFSESSNSFRWRGGFEFLSITTTDFATTEIFALTFLTWWYRRTVDSSWTVAKCALGWLQTNSGDFMKYWLHSRKMFLFSPNSVPQVFEEKQLNFFI